MFVRPAQAKIDLSALVNNFAQVQLRCANSEVMAVVKGNAYGHGMIEVAQVLTKADHFAVTDFAEYLQLRSVNIAQPITLLSDNLLHLDGLQVSDDQLWSTVFCLPTVELLQSNPQVKLNVWLKVDSGMGRLGFNIDQVDTIYHKLRRIPSIGQVGLLSHLPNADIKDDKKTLAQLEQLDKLAKRYHFDKHSHLNSAGICHYPEFANDIVRPGLMLYGASPSQASTAQQLSLQPAMALESSIISIRKMSKGAFIGYGSETQLLENTDVAIVALGYADGYPRSAFPSAKVVINGQQTHLLGRVSMDMVAIDVSDLTASVGDSVLFWGAEMPIEQVARASGTIAWELLAALPARVKRRYFDNIYASNKAKVRA